MTKKRISALGIAVLTVLVLLTSCTGSKETNKSGDPNNSSTQDTTVSVSSDKKASYKWNVTNKKYENFTDLGDYVIDLDPHANFDFEKALQYSNNRYDLGTRYACSALATKTDNGDVIIGRNLDLTVSQLPCYISHVKFGKYGTINFTYDELKHKALKYNEVLQQGKIDDEYYNALPLLATDSMNSEGLYLEYNMRGYEDQFYCAGTNPDAKLRICSISVPFVVASNCKTVKEALDYMRNELNIYTMLDKQGISGWNLCFMIGDATGEYGLIEIAKDEIRYIPYQNGQGNYYIYPEFNAISENQSGYGRLQFGMERVHSVQNDQDMANLMEQIMWRNEILNIEHAYRDKNGHIHFCKDKDHKTESLDWRSDNVQKIPINKDGKYVDTDANTTEAKLVRAYKECYDKYNAGIDPKINLMGHKYYIEYLSRCNLKWVMNDNNFEDLQKGLLKYYKESGTMDKLIKYYSGEEKPLRDDSNIWTTALSLSVNCTQKRLMVRFWEKPNTIIQYQW